MNDVLRTALAYHRARLAVLPVRADGSKAPALARCHPYLRRRPTEADLHRWFGAGDKGIAICCGAVSGHLETLDFETVAGCRRWRALVEAEAPGLVARLCWVLTPGHLGQRGLHARYRCPAVRIPGSMVLAYQAVAGQEEGCPCRQRRGPRRRVLIETRGEGAYAVAPGSPSGCHETGRSWEHVRGPDLLHLPELSVAERDLLLRAARELSCPAAEPDPPVLSVRHDPAAPLRPGDEYNLHGPDWLAILAPHGWALVRTDGRVRYWRRPGKSRGSWSASTGYCSNTAAGDLLYVFSSNAHPLSPGGYSKFRAYALLQHEGSFWAAAGELARQGFGKSRSGRPPRPRPVETAPFTDDVKTRAFSLPWAGPPRKGEMHPRPAACPVASPVPSPLHRREPALCAASCLT